MFRSSLAASLYDLAELSIVENVKLLPLFTSCGLSLGLISSGMTWSIIFKFKIKQLETFLFVGRDASVDWVSTIVQPATNLKNSGVEIFAAGIGNDLFQTELKIIVSSPSSSHIVNPKDYATLKGFGRRFAGMACGGRSWMRHSIMQGAPHIMMLRLLL